MIALQKAEVVGSKIPPGPFLSARELRYYFELVLGYCRTNPAAMPINNKDNLIRMS